MSFPRATARLQLHRDFTLHDARRQLPYYARLGISHLYLSPVSAARPGSMHGYDVVDHGSINPELGGAEAMHELAAAAHAEDMGLILDIVPNHMATHPGNAWWWDVLQHGPESRHATWFDIDWDSPVPGLRGKVLAPFLGEDYGNSLDKGVIALRRGKGAGSWLIEVAGTPYPVAPDSVDAAATDEKTLKRHDPRRIEGRQALHALLERQHYRLAWWRCAADLINWRRFFEITELIGLRVECDEVFDAVHRLPLQLYEDGLIDGLRIDHVDGLAQPLEYCRRLRAELERRAPRRPTERSGRQPWLIVEKILAPDEVLDERWAVDGTTGYEFMDQVSAVLHDARGEEPLTRFWNGLAPDMHPPAWVLRKARELMLSRHFAAERRNLLRALESLASSSLETRDWSRAAMGRVLDTLLAVFPVYRTYVENGSCAPPDAVRIAQSMAAVRREQDREVDGNELGFTDLLEAWLTPGSGGSGHERLENRRQAEVIRRFQQLTPPLAAKSLEDTSFYRYGRLLSRNEVGSDPAILALSVEEFHRRNAWRATHAPHAMLSTATHDQKRGEDARARLAVLSERAPEWAARADRWLKWEGPWTPGVGGARPAERLMLLQAVVGAWPLDLGPHDATQMTAFTERLVAWQTKALREAKLSTSWVAPNAEHERLAETELRALLQGGGSGLREDIFSMVCSLAPAGALNSLAQTLLRLTAPGVPDLYQGREFWDFSLVDPDNRQPVDHEARRSALDRLCASSPRDLLDDWRSGRIKQALIARTLRARRSRPDIWSEGRYLPAQLRGERATTLIAFVRHHTARRYILVIVPRHGAQALRLHGVGDQPFIAPPYWGDTQVVLPAECEPGPLRDLISGRDQGGPSLRSLPVGALLADFPVAVLSFPDSI